MYDEDDVFVRGLGDDETLLERAMRTGNLSMRCFAEEHGTSGTLARYNTLTERERQSYLRLPHAVDASMPTGGYMFRTFDGRAVAIPERVASCHPFFAYKCVDANPSSPRRPCDSKKA
jgi:hypothetical protein